MRQITAKFLYGAAALVCLYLVARGVFELLASTYGLLQTRHPINRLNDIPYGNISAFYLGKLPYQNPETGSFIGSLYAPLFAVLSAGFYHLYLWEGWPILLNIVATFFVLGTVATVASGGVGREGSRGMFSPRFLNLSAGFALAAVVWVLLGSNGYLTYSANADMFAWALASAGLAIVFLKGDRSLLAALMLLSLAVWSKQVTVSAVLAVMAWLAVRVIAGDLKVGSVLKPLLVVGFINGLAFLGMQLVTDGWFFYYIFAMAREHVIINSWVGAWLVILKDVIPLAALAAGLGLSLLLVARPFPRSGHPDLSTGRLRPFLSFLASPVGLLTIFAFVAVAAATHYLRKQGSVSNHTLGVQLAFALLAAAVLRRLLNIPGGGKAALVSVAALGLLTPTLINLFRIERESVALYNVDRKVEWFDMSPTVKRFLKQHVVYGWVNPAINVPHNRQLFSNMPEIVDTLAAGYQPNYIIETLLNRDIEVVTKMPKNFFHEGDNGWDDYISSYGDFPDSKEAHFIDKINDVIAARYEPMPLSKKMSYELRFYFASDLLIRKTGPEQATWQRRCFSPMWVAGKRFVIRRGGGFWCYDAGKKTTVTLRKTYEPISELRAAESVGRALGTVGLTLPERSYRSFAEIAIGESTRAAVRLRVERLPNGTASCSLWQNDKRLLLRSCRPAGQSGSSHFSIELKQTPDWQLNNDGVEAGRLFFGVPKQGGSGRFSLFASQNSGATFDLARLRLDR